jgi:hypothetical protein
LASAIAADPTFPATQPVKLFASKLSAMASLRLLGIISARNKRCRAASSPEGGDDSTPSSTSSTTPHASSHPVSNDSTNQKRRPPFSQDPPPRRVKKGRLKDVRATRWIDTG